MSRMKMMEQGITFNGDRIDVKIIDSIDQVDENEWDSINAPANLFRTHRFLRSVERARVEESKFWYLLFYKEGIFIASAVLSAFDVSLDLLMGSKIHRVVRLIRIMFRRFLRVKILFCGLPVSIGKNTLTIPDYTMAPMILKELIGAMTKIAGSQHINFICAKEFREDETPLVDDLKLYGFFRANSIPAVSLPIKWESFESYLANMRYGYRHQVASNLKKISGDGHHFREKTDENAELIIPAVGINSSRIYSHEIFYQLYMNVMNHADNRLETLNAEFFSQLKQNLSDELEIISIRYNEEDIGAAMIAGSGETLHFLFAGLNYTYRDKFDVYFNLIYAIIDLAIKRGYHNIDMGQTTYKPKLRMGGRCTPVYFYLRVNRPITSFIMKSLKKQIFPELIFTQPRVFRND